MTIPGSSAVPTITMAQMIEVDRLMIEEYGISLLQMMENAGRALATLARDRFLDGDPRRKPVTVLAGTGGNGGGALVAARMLHNAGATVSILTTRPDDRFSSAAAYQLAIVRRFGIPVSEGVPPTGRLPADVVLDGLIGYSLSGNPHGAAAGLITWANQTTTPILSLDTPSGLDVTTGKPGEPTVRATATLTLALPKQGFRAPESKPYVGELYLADIGVPPQLYAYIGLDVGPMFAQQDILRLV
jgi:NAD(P)H-hydrate epimerase